ncbi:hypothetical protein C3F09_06045 [candidate division GN15 bacterium]|uniref:BACON domain-containing protein n=1 Tax=candidate division GN15 bacterium TaxID=2072418 RepID=A0A855X3Y2_9BACT|nr:MAG: hypothetical protein C3F09_06045 [candidate division GN15 bacterium]
MNTLAGKLAIFCALILLVGVASSRAQDGVVSIYKLDGLISGTTVRAGDNLRFLIRFNNTTGQKCDVSNGFKLSSPDGAAWDSTTIDSIGPIVAGEAQYFIPYFDIAFAMFRGSADGVGEDTVGLIGAGSQTKPARQMPAGFNDSVFAITAWFNGKKSSAGKHICIDTSFYGMSGTWVWVGKNLLNYYPVMQGLTLSQPYSDGQPGTRLGSGYCFELYAPMLSVSKTELTFTAQQDEANPPAQTFDVASTGDGIGDHLSFSLIEASSWLNKSPSTGTTPRNIQVSVNTVGLGAGTYIDSIRVESPGAANSPLYVRVILEVTSPAPTIWVSKSSFSFVGIQSGGDPSPQTFIVKNTGGNVLNWMVSHTQTWLSASPSAGIDSTDITVSVSVVGLLSGDYYDTLVISDPAATNNPVRIPVKLSIGSSLPTIVVDSAINHVIVPAGSSLDFSRRVYVRNGGVGALTFSCSENSTRITGIVPTSGAAPESVQVTFKLAGVSNLTYHDTVWITSPEAVNSPYPVVFLTRIVDTPAVISLSRDTVNLTTYLCSQNEDSVLPFDQFVVYNVGGGNPMIVNLLTESDLFTLSDLSMEATALFTVQAAYPALLAGVYYDTILVTSEWAINSPQKLIVRYERTAGTQREILIPHDSITVFGQEHTGPAEFRLQMGNRYPGCLPWTVDEEIPWLEPSPANGNLLDWFMGIVDIDNLVLGTYRDSLYFVVSGASNSPKKFIVTAKVWRYYGDINWSGFVDVIDLSWLVSYLTTGSPVPLPLYIVGDVTCDDVVDLTDLSTMVAYITSQPGAYLCGNP